MTAITKLCRYSGGTLLTLKRRQAQTQGLQYQAQIRASSLLGVLQRLLAQHDPFAHNDGVRVAALATAIAKEMGFDTERSIKLSTAAQLHDIGHLLDSTIIVAATYCT